jgi:hypothetical protein
MFHHLLGHVREQKVAWGVQTSWHGWHGCSCRERYGKIRELIFRTTTTEESAC